MLGSSRNALAEGRDLLRQQIGDADAGALGAELFAVGNLLDDNRSLRRALADPSRDAHGKQELASQLLAGKVSEPAVAVTRTLVAQRWSEEVDLVSALEELAVEAVLTGAERDNALDRVEDELFRFERIVAGSPQLQNALSDYRRSDADKAALVGGLVDGKVAIQTHQLITQAVAHPRDQRLNRVLKAYGDIAARLREQLVATVTSAIALDAGLQQRLSAALGSIYGRPVHTDLVVDPSVIGGLRIQVGDEIIDGTILSRLGQAQRLFAG